MMSEYFEPTPPESDEEGFTSIYEKEVLMGSKKYTYMGKKLCLCAQKTRLDFLLNKSFFYAVTFL